MFEDNFSSKQSIEESRGGAPITATYGDAIKFARNSTMDTVKKTFDGDGPTSPMMMLLKVRDAATKLDAVVSTIAFVYGKTEDEVRRDLTRAEA